MPPASCVLLLGRDVGDTWVGLWQEATTATVWWQLMPASLRCAAIPKRLDLEADISVCKLPAPWRPVAAARASAAVQIHLAGDAQPGGFSAGRTMRSSGSVDRFHLLHWREQEDGDGFWGLEVCWLDSNGLRLTWRLVADDHEYPVFFSTSELVNGSDSEVTVEMLSSFCLDGITPWHQADAPECLRLHRLLGEWSAEGRVLTQDFEGLELERSWLGVAVRGLRFGAVGSMPVNRFFPFVAVEDAASGVVWGAQPECGSSWQCEIWRAGDGVSISGGLADYEFGHWRMSLPPGASFTTPPARVACLRGGIDELGRRLAGGAPPLLVAASPGEEELPLVFNDWCTHWGDPDEDAIIAAARAVSDWPVRYYVIDAGWYSERGASWNDSHGDWDPASTRFPRGLEQTAAELRALGLVPGLWFEFETCGLHSRLFHDPAAPLLHRGGVPLTSGHRRFLDFRNEKTWRYLARKVCALIERCGIGYLKADYNETIGVGADGAESPGEALRRHIERVQEFYLHLKERCPGLVVEICASGGHRLEPSFLRRCDLVSFSDAHETPNIPLVAADLHRLVRPAQSLVWAVLRAADSPARLVYSLAAGFLGRLCLSGDAAGLDPAQHRLVGEACAFYREMVPLIREGVSCVRQEVSPNHLNPRGWQAVRVDLGPRRMFVLHAFGDPPDEIAVETGLPASRVTRLMGSNDRSPEVCGGHLVWRPPEPFSATVVALDAVDSAGVKRVGSTRRARRGRQC